MVTFSLLTSYFFRVSAKSSSSFSLSLCGLSLRVRLDLSPARGQSCISLSCTNIYIFKLLCAFLVQSVGVLFISTDVCVGCF